VSELTKEQLEELTGWAQSRTLLAGDVFRARLMLALAEGKSWSQIEIELQTSRPTIARWKSRFEQQGMVGLDPRHRGSEPRLSNGVAVLASYTFGKLISDSAIVPSNFGAVEVGSDNGYQNGQFNRKAERSVDPTDVAQRLVLSGIVELSFGKGKHWNFHNPLAARLTAGWQS
jgi:hypothetical protein